MSSPSSDLLFILAWWDDDAHKPLAYVVSSCTESTAVPPPPPRQIAAMTESDPGKRHYSARASLSIEIPRVGRFVSADIDRVPKLGASDICAAYQTMLR